MANYDHGSGNEFDGKLDFGKIKPGDIAFPEEWFKKADFNYWPIPEGLWLRGKGDEYLARIMYLSMVLVELPEAQVDLNICNRQFHKKFAAPYFKLFKQFINQCGRSISQELYFQLWKRYDSKATAMLQAQQSEVMRIYRSWTKKWAVESEAMAAWAFSGSFYNLVLQSLGRDPNLITKEMFTVRGDMVRMYGERS